MPPTEFSQSCLLDRLADDSPRQRIQSATKLGSAGDTRERLRFALSALLNATPLEAAVGLSRFPEIRRSGLNYGALDFSGKAGSGLSARLVERQLRAAILRYEPRLIADRLTIRATVGGPGGPNSLVVEIEGQLWAQPRPEEIRLRGLFDLEAGQASVRSGEGG